jgi:peptidyl-prolyl cis-trans isomerase B (cyclophilin B)
MLARGRIDDATQVTSEARKLFADLDPQVSSFQTELARARQQRPSDPVVQWLTGELLMIVGGEPEDIRPYFQRAVKSGLKRPEALTNLARMQFELNQFDAAYQSASIALDQDQQRPQSWEIFAGVGLSTGHFEEVLQRFAGTFRDVTPEWAKAIHERALSLSAQWATEQQQRQLDKLTDNRPRVRLTIEHQTFDGDSRQLPLLKPKRTGRGEVEIELFEDQAPATVANFVSLVDARFYNGTRFHWAQPAHIVVGGDPNTRNADPGDDGSGGPGYVIPDESNLRAARPHFRGTISMFETEPHTAGSQFLICLVSCPEFNGHSTAFGRVIRGQDVVDRITQGRTRVKAGQLEKTIPGDLLVRAQVIRKRPHSLSRLETQVNARNPGSA